jgi:N-acyl-phosphatidylethanolamine-hydrolysing phospholipase D
LTATLGALALVVAALVAGCAGVGEPKPGAPAHHRERGFANTNPEFTRPPLSRRVSFFVSRVLSTTFAPRTIDLPRVANDGRALRDATGAPTLTWVGHATLLIQLDGMNVLTDPHWSERASPVSWGGPKRVMPPGLAFEDLPPIHVVLISHDHYDHLDVATVRRLAETHRPRFLVPLGLKAWFADLGIHDVEELDWWNARERGALRFTCVPAQHFSGRSLGSQNRTLWAGWVIEGPTRRAFFSGDTGYDPAIFREIGTRLGPFDVAAVSIGAYLPPVMMRAVHTTPEEALRIFADLRGRHFVPIHWGTFDLADEPLDEPPRRLAAEAARLGLGDDRVWLFRHGETRRW